jgi:hypothetical protein
MRRNICRFHVNVCCFVRLKKNWSVSRHFNSTLPISYLIKIRWVVLEWFHAYRRMDEVIWTGAPQDCNRAYNVLH